MTYGELTWFFLVLADPSRCPCGCLRVHWERPRGWKHSQGQGHLQGGPGSRRYREQQHLELELSMIICQRLRVDMFLNRRNSGRGSGHRPRQLQVGHGIHLHV